MFAQQAFRRSSKTRQWILNDVAKQSLAEFAVVNRGAQTELGIQALAVPFPEFHIVFPAGKEEFPLQLSHVDHLGAGLLLHARVFKRHKESWNKGSLSVAQIVKQVERLFNVVVSFAGKSNNESAKRKPVVPVQDFHSLQHYIAPLMPFVGICFAFHVSVEKACAARFETDNRVRRPLIQISRVSVLH